MSCKFRCFSYNFFLIFINSRLTNHHFTFIDHPLQNRYVVPSSPAGGAGVKLAHAVVFNLRQNDKDVASELHADQAKNEDRLRRQSTLQARMHLFGSQKLRKKITLMVFTKLMLS